MKRINKTNLNSETYWNKHIAKPDFGLRQKKYLDLAGKGNKLIELGCGMSPFLDKARKNFKECRGLDFSKQTIIEAREKYPKVIYFLGDAVKTGLPDKEFDVSVAGELIEHLKNPEKLITEMIRITKKRVIISTAKMEYNDPEHLWEFNEDDFPFWNVERIKSKRFPGRSYLFVTIDL